MQLVPFLILSLAACTPHGGSVRSSPIEATRVLALHRSWWNALATSDGESLRAHSSPHLVATLSSGRQHDLDSLAGRGDAPRRTPKIDCVGESVQHLDSRTAVVTSDCTESSGQYSTTYRFLSFLANSPDGWKVAAAQSTWRATFTPRMKVAASLDAFAGAYRTPRGLALDVQAGENFLTLREPSGLTLRLEPIGPNLFEADYVAPGGWITRYSFDRDATGDVVSVSILSPGAVNTFPRIR
jgi:hypothetical protein